MSIPLLRKRHGVQDCRVSTRLETRTPDLVGLTVDTLGPKPLTNLVFQKIQGTTLKKRGRRKESKTPIYTVLHLKEPHTLEKGSL